MAVANPFEAKNDSFSESIMAVANPFEAKNVSFSESRRCRLKFMYYRDEERTVDFPHPNGECNTCGDETGLKMKCGHFICPDDILNKAWIDVECMMYKITCTSCDREISLQDVIKFGLPKLDEEQFLTTAITTNFYKSQDIQQCPQCDTLYQRELKDSPQVVCTICPHQGTQRFTFCWYCMREWKNGSNHWICGNANCLTEEFEALVNSPSKYFTDARGKTISIPIRRACPNSSCLTLIKHTDRCSWMTCSRCRKQFCFICLATAESMKCKTRNWYGSVEIKCRVAPIQTKLY